LLPVGPVGYRDFLINPGRLCSGAMRGAERSADKELSDGTTQFAEEVTGDGTTLGWSQGAGRWALVQHAAPVGRELDSELGPETPPNPGVTSPESAVHEVESRYVDQVEDAPILSGGSPRRNSSVVAPFIDERSYSSEAGESLGSGMW